MTKDGARISFLVPSLSDARFLVESMDSTKQYTLTVKEYKPKRSLSANALMWAVLGELATVMKLEKADELYRKYILETPYYVVAEIWEDDLQRAKETWESNGIGWQLIPTEVSDESGGMSKYVVRMWYGSSQYDKDQMKHLIDCIQQDADAVGLVSDNLRNLMEAYPNGQ